MFTHTGSKKYTERTLEYYSHPSGYTAVVQNITLPVSLAGIFVWLYRDPAYQLAGDTLMYGDGPYLSVDEAITAAESVLTSTSHDAPQAP